MRSALARLAPDVARPGRVPGKSVKTIRGTEDSFDRLRVGDHRVMFDVVESDHVILVLGIVDRADLERWLRSNSTPQCGAAGPASRCNGAIAR